jgi:hypothetical protein
MTDTKHFHSQKLCLACAESRVRVSMCVLFGILLH